MVLGGFAFTCVMVAVFLCGLRVGLLIAAEPKQLSPLDEAIKQIEAIAPTKSGCEDDHERGRGRSWVSAGPYTIVGSCNKYKAQIQVGNVTIPDTQTKKEQEKINALVGRKLVELASEMSLQQLLDDEMPSRRLELRAQESTCRTDTPISSLNSDTRPES